MKAALRLVYTLLFLLALLGGTAVALEVFGPTAALVSPPEMVAEQFVHAFGLRRWDAARQYLAQDIRDQATDEFLRARIEAVEARAGAIDQTHGEPGNQTREAATAQVKVKTRRNIELNTAFDLKVENDEWVIASLDGLRRLAEGTR